MLTQEPQSQPTGTKLVRLADVPLNERLIAVHNLMRNEGLSPEEAQDYLALILDPGDISARIAA